MKNVFTNPGAVTLLHELDRLIGDDSPIKEDRTPGYRFRGKGIILTPKKPRGINEHTRVEVQWNQRSFLSLVFSKNTDFLHIEIANRTEEIRNPDTQCQRIIFLAQRIITQ